MLEGVVKEVDRGREGLNKGFPMGFPRLIEHIPDIQKGTSYLIFGESGSGKSAFVDTAYVFNPLDWYLKNKDNTNLKIKILYYSLEISKDRLLLKQITRKIYIDTGLLLDVNYILSRGKHRIRQEHYELVLKYCKYFEQLSEYLIIKDNSTSNHPYAIYRDLWNYSEEVGTYEKNADGIITNYKEKDPNLYTVIITDHLGLVPPEKGADKKTTMDKLSSHQVLFRNRCKFTFANLMQVNRSVNDIDRIKLQKEKFFLSLADIKNSGNPAEDCDTAIGIFNPNNYEFNNYRGYNITRLKDRSRFLNIVKNRDGEAHKSLGLLFLGEVGFFKEFPHAVDMTNDIYDSISNL